jgi:hypothetical protein
LLYSGRLLYKIEKEARQKDRWALDAAVLEAVRGKEVLRAAVCGASGAGNGAAAAF